MLLTENIKDYLNHCQYYLNCMQRHLQTTQLTCVFHTTTNTVRLEVKINLSINKVGKDYNHQE